MRIIGNRIVYPFLCLLFLAGCASLQQPNEYAVSVTLPEDSRMHFSGKGAGAGMMLMSSMGAMGIAIGVAIDEGIAKDIGNAAAGVNIAALAEKECQQAAQQRQQHLDIQLLEYGFETAPGLSGVDDPVVPKIIADIRVGEAESQRWVVDKSVADACYLPGWPLAEIKVNGALVVEALRAGFGCLGARLLQ